MNSEMHPYMDSYKSWRMYDTWARTWTTTRFHIRTHDCVGSLYWHGYPTLIMGHSYWRCHISQICHPCQSRRSLQDRIADLFPCQTIFYTLIKHGLNLKFLFINPQTNNLSVTNMIWANKLLSMAVYQHVDNRAQLKNLGVNILVQEKRAQFRGGNCRFRVLFFLRADTFKEIPRATKMTKLKFRNHQAELNKETLTKSSKLHASMKIWHICQTSTNFSEFGQCVNFGKKS